MADRTNRQAEVTPFGPGDKQITVTENLDKVLLDVSATAPDGDRDSFGRLRVSNVKTLFDSQLQYGKNDETWYESVSGAGASSTHLPNEAAVRLRVGTVSGEKVYRRTNRYFRYQPGKSQNVTLTAVLGGGKANVRSRIGYFDDSNGLFYELDGTTLYIVRRTYTSGSVVDNRVAQSSWNIDPLDGTGPSGYTLDTSKGNIYGIDFQWLGVGRVRFAVNIDGKGVPVHEIDNANSLTTVYMTTANLPVTYEIENTGTSASQTDLYQICTSVQSEGGSAAYDNAGHIFSAFNLDDTAVSASAWTPIISIRLKSTFNSLTNRGVIFPSLIDSLSSTTTAVGILTGATLTGASWVSVDDDSIAEYDVSATSYTGGLPHSYRFIPSGGNSQTTAGDLPLFRNPLTLDAPGTTSKIITIAGRSLSGTGQMRSSIVWTELY